MPGGTLIAIIFFVAVLFAGMTSLLNLYEAPIATVQEKLHLGRVPACAVIGIIGAAVSLLIQGIVSDWMDVLSIYICPSVPDSPESCSSGYLEKTMQKRRSTKAAKRNFQNGLYRCAAIFIFRYVCWY